MGNERAYHEGGQLRNYEYTTLSQRVTINGVTGKMIEKKSDFASKYKGLPAHSESSDIYFNPGDDGYADQAKLYKDHSMVLDFDWSHTHTNKGKNGETFEKGTIHIQEYRMVRVRKNGKWVHEFRRLKNARRMTPEEIAKYGPIIRHFNPYVKFQ